MICDRLILGVVLCAAVASARFLSLHENYQVELDITGTGENATISLIITANTKGYVGFGIGPNPNMTGADLFIGGVNGTEVYGKDYHSTDNEVPIEDCEGCQNWDVLWANETSTSTVVALERLLDTKDTEGDIKIENSDIYLLWSYGEFDVIVHHYRRGSRLLNLFTADDGVVTSPTP